MFIDWLTSNVAWALLIAIAVFSIVWAVASRARSRRWGEPTEFAGTMPEDRELEAHAALRRAYERGEITKEEFEQRSQHMDLGR